MNRIFFEKIYESLDPKARQEFDDLSKFQLRKSMEVCKMNDYPEVKGDIMRASGDCVCEVCGREYFDHPYDWRLIGYGDVPFTNILCDGTRVKL